MLDNPITLEVIFLPPRIGIFWDPSLSFSDSDMGDVPEYSTHFVMQRFKFIPTLVQLVFRKKLHDCKNGLFVAN